MWRTTIHCGCTLLLAASAARGAEQVAAAPAPKAGDKELSGMSIVGNDDAPKSLAIVPWKSWRWARARRARALDDRQPVDRDVQTGFDYYQIRAESAGRKSEGQVRWSSVFRGRILFRGGLFMPRSR
jgi:hypothetical protein